MTKKPEKRQKSYQCILGNCPDHLNKYPNHPRCSIEIQFGTVGGLRVVVLSFKFHQNQFSKMWGIKIWLIALLWPLAYTTACTTIQACYRMNFFSIIDETHRRGDTRMPECYAVSTSVFKACWCLEQRAQAGRCKEKKSHTEFLLLVWMLY